MPALPTTNGQAPTAPVPFTGALTRVTPSRSDDAHLFGLFADMAAKTGRENLRPLPSDPILARRLANAL